MNVRGWMVAKIAMAAAILTAGAAAWAQAPGPSGPRPPLVDCAVVADVPCSIVATSPADIAGVWKQFLGNPAFGAIGGVGYIRYRPDGTYSLADSVADTAAPLPPFPSGRVTFEGAVMRMHVDGANVPPECREATYQVQVIRSGNLPVALFYQAIEDACTPRRTGDLSVPLYWVAP